jgi:Fungal fruit body lectin/Heterokaryon incompatibility protein (HET)
MRLLHLETRKLKEFQGNIPDYAILSHTWGDEEVLFQDLQNESKARAMKGYSKIEGACAQALRDGFEYVWIDTCCINKESSAELSEAINSMYAWYQDSQVCYAYLADTPSEEDATSKSSSFAKSRWFKRGWTLQELLAPSSVIFYGRDWKEIGTKASLQEVIYGVTGVEWSVLLGNYGAEISIARRMSWASRRQTTRVEDEAYCLMGIFGVHMPTIYGEGRNAFIRLQQEILKVSDDQTIFAWEGPGKERGLLAHSPAEFVHSGDVSLKAADDPASEYSMTNKGISIRLPLKPVEQRSDVFLATLPNCVIGHEHQALGIYLKRESGQQFVRVHPDRVEIGDGGLSRVEARTEAVYVKETNTAKFNSAQHIRSRGQYTFSIETGLLFKHHFAISEAAPSNFFRSSEHGVWHLSMGGSGTSGALTFRNGISGEQFVVMLGVHNYVPWTDVVTNFGDETGQSIRDSYYSPNGRGGTLWYNMDRKSAFLKEGRSVSVSIKNRISSKEERKYIAQIIVERGAPSSVQLESRRYTLRQNPRYVFPVTMQPSGTPFRITEMFPINFWSNDSENGGRYLFMDGSGTSGILMFHNKYSGERFAVLLGVHNYAVWTDVVTKFGNETAQSIRDSYYGGARSAALWTNKGSKVVSLRERKSVSVSIKERVLAGYPTEIIIK